MIKGRKKTIAQMARTAGDIVRRAIPTEGVTEKRGRSNFVTAADLASEKAIIDFIHQNYPEDQILSEETTSNIENPLRVDKLWVIDPIDGTSNFRFQRNCSAVSIGYIENGVIQLGVAYDPFRDELFSAERGKGAYLNGSKIEVRDLSELSKATVATDNSYNPAGTRNNLELFLRLSPSPWILIKGSAVLNMCDVAAGRIDLYFHNYLKPFDNAAAFLIAKEAGAKITTIDGKEPNFLSESVVMGNERLVEQFLQQIA